MEETNGILSTVFAYSLNKRLAQMDYKTFGAIHPLKTHADKLLFIKKVIAVKFDINMSEISLDLNLIRDYGVDASDIVELIVECKKFIQPPYCRVKQLETVGDIMMYFGVDMPKPQSGLKAQL